MKKLLVIAVLTALAGPTAVSAKPGDTWVCKELTNNSMKCEKLFK